MIFPCINCGFYNFDHVIKYIPIPCHRQAYVQMDLGNETETITLRTEDRGQKLGVDIVPTLKDDLETSKQCI